MRVPAHALQVFQLALQLQSSPHENMKANDHDDLANLKAVYERRFQHLSVQYELDVKVGIHLKLRDARNDAMLFPDFHARKMQLPHSINSGI